jgi:sugar phosphate isomerase/epimerase
MPLSFMLDTVRWDGKTISPLPFEQIGQRMEMFLSCGINEVMLSGYHLEEEATFSLEKESTHIGLELSNRDMKAAQHHGVAACMAPLGQNQQVVIDTLKKVVDYTVNLHADSLVIHLGKLNRHYVKIEDEINEFQAQIKQHGLHNVINQVAENLHTAGEYAAQGNIRIALENLDNFHPLSDMATLPQVVQKADSPAVGYCLDSGHAHCVGNSVLEWISIMGDKLFTTHFHDNRGANRVVKPGELISSKGIDEHLPPGFGTLSWRDIISALRGQNYSYTVNFESPGWPGMAPKAGFECAIAYWGTCEMLAEGAS